MVHGTDNICKCKGRNPRRRPSLSGTAQITPQTPPPSWPQIGQLVSPLKSFKINLSRGPSPPLQSNLGNFCKKCQINFGRGVSLCIQLGKLALLEKVWKLIWDPPHAQKKGCFFLQMLLIIVVTLPPVWYCRDWTPLHTSYLSRTPRIYSCKFFLAGVNFYRFNAKNLQFTVYFVTMLNFFFYIAELSCNIHKPSWQAFGPPAKQECGQKVPQTIQASVYTPLPSPEWAIPIWTDHFLKRGFPYRPSDHCDEPS